MAQRAGLGSWHVHEARHTAASLMLAMGTTMEIVSRVLGHSSVIVTADVYSHLLGGKKRAAAAAMTSALLGPNSGFVASPSSGHQLIGGLGSQKRPLSVQPITS